MLIITGLFYRQSCFHRQHTTGQPVLICEGQSKQQHEVSRLSGAASLSIMMVIGVIE